MGEYLDQIPENIQGHIKQITKTSGLGEGDDAIEIIAEGWLEKKKSFEETIGESGMEEVDTLSKDDEKGALIMTYSGSLINLGPITDGIRKAGYASIGLRQDVPDMISKDDTNLSADVNIDEPVEFENGPVKKTSAIFKIAVCKDELSAEEQEGQINQAATVIIDDFVEVNKTIIAE